MWNYTDTELYTKLMPKDDDESNNKCSYFLGLCKVCVLMTSGVMYVMVDVSKRC